MAHVKKTPLYPISNTADVLEQFTQFVGEHEKFRAITNEVDVLIRDRAGSDAVADRAIRRASILLEQESFVAAIDELQQAKVSWFAAETLENSVLSMLTISEAFEALHLYYAARYYAAGALYIALHENDEQLKRRIGQAFFRIADSFYVAGEGVTYFYSITEALAAHGHFESDPEDWSRHPSVERAMTHAAILRAIARRIAPGLLKTIDKAIDNWPLSSLERSELIKLTESGVWACMPISEIEAKIATEAGQHPFGDTGDHRSATWSALGIEWTVHSASDRDTWMAALEVAATLQIVQVEFARVELLIVPSKAELEVVLEDIDDVSVIRRLSNKSLIWRVAMPSRPKDLNSLAAGLFGIATGVIGEATALNLERFTKLVEEKLESGMSHRVFSVRPARELMRLAQPEVLNMSTLSAHKRPALSADMRPLESGELRWCRAPGPGYSHAQALDRLKKRYELFAKALSKTLPRIVGDPRCLGLISELRQEGLLDWQILSILAHVVAHWQTAKRFDELNAQEFVPNFQERLFREERDDDPLFDLGQLTDESVQPYKSMVVGAAFKAWGLSMNRQTPDFTAMKQLLDVRYGHSTDDIDHTDLFGLHG